MVLQTLIENANYIGFGLVSAMLLMPRARFVRFFIALFAGLQLARTLATRHDDTTIIWMSILLGLAVLLLAWDILGGRRARLSREEQAMVAAMLNRVPKGRAKHFIEQGFWLNGKRGGYGAWGNTQATILGLKALTAYTEHARQMAAPGTAILVINGKNAGTIQFDKGRRDALVWSDVAGKLAPGENTIELRLDGQAQLPYSIAIEYRSAQPRSSPRSKIAVSTQLLKTQARMGEGVEVLASYEGHPVAIRGDGVLATVFHPELTEDPRIHALFMAMTTSSLDSGVGREREEAES